MPLTPSQRPTREWPLLILTVIIVGLVCYPFVHLIADESTMTWLNWPAKRWTRLLLGPEQVACYCCFLWGFLIFLSHYRESHRQRSAFRLDLLPTADGARILQEDARPLQRKLDQLTITHGPFILANMIRAGLAKFATSRSSDDVRETLKTQADVDFGRLVASMATLNYLAWAIPAIGFFGTVRGLASSMTLAEGGGAALREATQHLTVAFDCTLVALFLSLIIMFVIHMLQRDEESLVCDCQQYCLEHLVNRLYEPVVANAQGMNASADSMMPGGLPERVAR